jgi:L-ascorbate metabolism protein UlaG (beta-lactamase superfamily)
MPCSQARERQRSRGSTGAGDQRRALHGRQSAPRVDLTRFDGRVGVVRQACVPLRTSGFHAVIIDQKSRVAERASADSRHNGQVAIALPIRRLNLSWRDLRFVRGISRDYARSIAPAPHRPDLSRWRDDRMTAAWLGHATMLLDVFGIRMITDPALRARVGIRVGPVTLGPKRYVAPALRVRDLPGLDFVLLTHAHMDHLDLATLRRLPRDVTVVTAAATADLVAPLGFRDVVELGWGESRRFATPRGEVTVEALRVRHWGARMRHDVHRGFNGYLIERCGRRVCFAGDTAFTSFHDIGRRGGVDLMAVPIGAYDPWIASHCTPEQAAEMANQAGARFVAPIHHQTFRLSREPMDEPIRRFVRALAPDRVALREIGETFVLPGTGC